MPQNDALIARDPGLPGLALLLDRPALEAGLGAPIAALGSLRYKPGTSCTRAVRLADGRHLWLKALTRDRHGQVLARGQDLAPQGLRDRHVVAQSPAADRDIPGLKRLWPEQSRPAELARLLGDHPLSRAVLHPLSHRPTRRLVARLDAGGTRAFLKAYTRKAHAQALSGILLAATLGHGRVLAACAERGLIVSDWIDGRSLCPANDAALDPRAFRQAGAALATVHGARLRTPFQATRFDAVRRLRALAKDIGRLLPEQRARASDVAERLVAALASVPEQYGLIHGDFSADQILVGTDDAITIIDWDRAAMGDQGSDLGSALARLEVQRLWHDLPEAAAKTATEALLAGYGDVRPLPASWSVQETAHLFLLLGEAFRHQLPDWPARTCALLDRVEAGLRTAPAPQVDPELPQLATLLDPQGAAQALAAHQSLTVVAPPKLRRHKPGRRALIDVTARDAAGDATDYLIKTRAKRADHATPAYHAALRAAGFTEGGTGAFAVPEAWPGPPRLRAWSMRKVPGRTLTACLHPKAPVAPFRQAGRALAALHACHVEGVPRWTPEAEWDVLARALDHAADAHPGDSEALAGLRRAARIALDRVPKRPDVLLHRDFYPDQLLVEESRLWMIDLDLLAMGDRHVDVGNFLAHLDEQGLRDHGAVQVFYNHARAFLAGYQEAGTLDMASVRVLRDVSLARHLHICDRIASRKPCYPKLLAELSRRFDLGDAMGRAPHLARATLVPQPEAAARTPAG